MSITYKVQVNLNDKTLPKLEKFQMQVYKGVVSANTAGALPTVWYSVKKFSNEVTASWSETYGGYFSNTEIAEGATVDIRSHKKMDPGNVITLYKDGTTKVSTVGGVPNAFCFKSEQKEEWASGLMVAPIGQPLAPVCAFPQYGAIGNIIKPYQRVLILFTQDQLDTGAVVETAISESITITLSPDEPDIKVAFDINEGWDTMGNPQATRNPQNFALAPTLIVPSPTLANILRKG